MYIDDKPLTDGERLRAHVAMKDDSPLHWEDDSEVGGIEPPMRSYAPDPLATWKNDHSAGNQWEQDLLPRPRSHFQPEVKVKRDSNKWRMAGDVIAFLFLAAGFGLMLMYFGAFGVIGAAIHEVMQ